MKIRFESGGGLEGIFTEKTIDTRTMHADDSSVLEKLVASSNFFELPKFVKSDINGADFFNYKITVEMGEKRHTIERNDLTLETRLQPLFDYLRS